MDTNTTRRAVFAGALTTAIAGHAATAPSGSLADMWAHSQACEKLIDATDYNDDEDALAADMRVVNAMHGAILRGAIRTRADAIAKLRVAGLAFERGNRSDDLDLPGHEDAIRWLEAH